MSHMTKEVLRWSVYGVIGCFALGLGIAVMIIPIVIIGRALGIQ